MQCQFDQETQSGTILLSGAAGNQFQQALGALNEQCKQLTIQCSTQSELIDLGKIPPFIRDLTLRQCCVSFSSFKSASQLQIEALTLINCRCQIWSEISQFMASCQLLKQVSVDLASRFSGFLQICQEQNRPHLSVLCSNLHFIKNLTNLDVSGCQWVSEFHLEECQQLMCLNANKTSITCLSGLPQSVQELYVCECESLQSISHIQTLHNISILQAAKCPKLSTSLTELIEVTENLPVLEFINISCCKTFSDGDSKAALRQFKKLMAANPYTLISEQLSDLELTQEQQLALQLKKISRQNRKSLQQLQRSLEDQIQNLTDQTQLLTAKVDLEIERGKQIDAQLKKAVDARDQKNDC